MIGEVSDRAMQAFRDPEFRMGLKNVKPWLQHSARGQQFIVLAKQHAYTDSNMGNLYRRYVNWYFHNEVTNGEHHDQATLRSDRDSAG